MDELKNSPRPDGVKKLKGFKNLYRIRIGDFRVIYEIDDSARIIFITKVVNRREAY
jgi:mRNA interferase RelE/StbE